MRRGQHTGHAITEVVSSYMNRPQFQGLNHSGYVVRHSLERDPLAWTCALARAPEVDANHPVASLGERICQTIQVAHGETSTGQQNDRFTFASAEILDTGVGQLDDTGLHGL